MRIITRTIFILSMVSLLADIASEMLYPVMPVYLQEIGFSVLWIGILEGFVNFTAGISKGYFGKKSDEAGLRLPFVKLGYFLSALSKPLVATFVYPLWIFFVRTIDRLGKGIRTAARDALLSEEATPETKARVFGFHRGMDTLGASIGPVLALLFLLFYPGQYNTLFYLAFIPGLLSVLLVFLLKEKKKEVSTLRKGNFFSFFNYWKIAHPDYRKVVIGLIIFELFNSSDIFLLLITKQAIGDTHFRFLGKTFDANTITIAAYIFYNLVYALVSYPLGILADKIKFRSLLVSGFLLFAVVYAGFGLHPGLATILILFAVYGIYAGATEGITKAWISNLAHGKNTATAIGFYTSCQSLCSLLASIIAGALWMKFGSTTTFFATAAVAVLVSIYFLLLRPSKVIIHSS
jgi:MFS family permease